MMDASDLRNEKFTNDLIDAINSIPHENNIPVAIIIEEVDGKYTVETKGYCFDMLYKPLCYKGSNEDLIVAPCSNKAIEKVCLEYISTSLDKDRAISQIYAEYYLHLDCSCDYCDLGLRLHTSMLYALTTTARYAYKYFRGTIFEEMVTKRKKFIRPIRDMWKLHGININKYV